MFLCFFSLNMHVYLCKTNTNLKNVFTERCYTVFFGGDKCFTSSFVQIRSGRCVSKANEYIRCTKNKPIKLNKASSFYYQLFITHWLSHFHSRNFSLKQGVSAYKMLCSFLLHRSDTGLSCFCGYAHSHQNLCKFV